MLKIPYQATEKAKLIAAEQYQKALMEQVTAREKAKEEAYQQYLKGLTV